MVPTGNYHVEFDIVYKTKGYWQVHKFHKKYVYRRTSQGPGESQQ